MVNFYVYLKINERKSCNSFNNDAADLIIIMPS